MSLVTNVILRTPLLNENEKKHFSKKINSFFGSSKGFVNCDDEKLPIGWYGGTKMLEAELWIGSFNYLDLEGLVKHLKTIDWDIGYEDWVQIIYQEQQDDKFSIIEFMVN
jgi:hypothetical protein